MVSDALEMLVVDEAARVVTENDGRGDDVVGAEMNESPMPSGFDVEELVVVVTTRFPCGKCRGEWRKNDLNNLQHAILYHTHIISYYDLTKYRCCSTCGSMRV